MAAPVLLTFAFIWLEIAEKPLLPVLACGLGVLLNLFVAYLSAAASDLDRLRREGVWEEIQRLNIDATGHLALIIEEFSKRHRLPAGQRTNKAAYHQKLRELQQHLLSHMVNLIATEIDEKPNGVLAANWTLRGTWQGKDAFRVEAYDRNRPDRKPRNDNWKLIEEDRPGASVAFLESKISLVKDTHSIEFAAFFEEKPNYRSILSIPVDCLGKVIGVVNVDSTKIDLLKIEHGSLVLDIVYLVGLCEVLRQEGAQ